MSRNKIAKIWVFFSNPPEENLTGTGSYYDGIGATQDRRPRRTHFERATSGEPKSRNHRAWNMFSMIVSQR